MDIKQEAMKKHYEWHGKIEVVPRASVVFLHGLLLNIH